MNKDKCMARSHEQRPSTVLVKFNDGNAWYPYCNECGEVWAKRFFTPSVLEVEAIRKIRPPKKNEPC